MRIHFVVKPGNGPDWHRMLLPMECLPLKEGDTLQMAVYGTEEVPGLYNCDVLVFNRQLKTPASKLIKYREQFGFKLVLDLDDYWELGYTHPLYDAWNKDRTGETILSYIKIADQVWVTNGQLRAKVLPENQNVVIIPNALDFPSIAHKPKGKMRFIYSGSVTHGPDLEILRNKFRRTEPFIRNSASFVLAGVSMDVRWGKMISVFEDTGSYEIRQVLPLDKYMTHYDSCHVALVPLAVNEFNSCKSILKVLEAATTGLPCIVSKVQPYYPELSDAPGIMWAEESSDWLRYIRQCIKNPNWVTDQGKQLHEYMKERYSLDKINQQRYEILHSIVH